MTYSKPDVFISYSRHDSEHAEIVARFLRDTGLSVWLDRWSLVPGVAWQDSLKIAMENTLSVAVCTGPSGLSSAQEQELQPALRTSALRGIPRIIPVLLPGAQPGTFPPFLQNRPFVDLRHLEDEQEISHLVSEIESSKAGGEIEQERQLGDSLRASESLVESAQHYDLALQAAQTEYGESHPIVADLFVRLANVRRDLGEYLYAATLLKKSLDISREVYGPDSASLAPTLNNLGNVLRDLGRLDEARRLLYQSPGN